MAMLSPKRAGVPLLPYLKLMSRGKVRDTYELENGLIWVVATNGISTFDFVLNALIPEKGIILNTLEMAPETEQNYLSEGPAKYALEMNVGWFDHNHLKAGDVVEGALNAPKAEE